MIYFQTLQSAPFAVDRSKFSIVSDTTIGLLPIVLDPTLDLLVLRKVQGMCPKV
jgi:hypothetical protein